MARDYLETGKLLREVAEQTDRAAAVLAAAFLDELLKEAIKRRFAVNDDETDMLLESDSLLRGYAAKARLAYAIGIVSKSVWEDLRYIGKIRNEFAHKCLLPDGHGSATEVSFETQTVKDLVRNLKCFELACGHTEEDHETPINSRTRFLATFRLLMAGLYQYCREEVDKVE